MPELPEVETTRLRIAPELCGKKIMAAELRVSKLRVPVTAGLDTLLTGTTLRSIERRGKYLLFDCESGWLLLHLGMTGFLQLLPADTPHGKHDHADLLFENGQLLRFHDPRKFGTLLWVSGDVYRHPLLAAIGPEPLSGTFDGAYLYAATRKRAVAIKQLVMDSAVVAGVGNIYANEALFRAGIRPDRPAGTLTLQECELLAAQVCTVLAESIAIGSSFRIVGAGVAYHPLDFNVYGRGGQACTNCGANLEELRLGNRSSVFCPVCQK